MRNRRKRPMAGWILLIGLLIVIIAAIFTLAWLGGERDQKMVEQPIAIPGDAVGQ
ncbi:hypothetical protein ACFOWX_04725 [Sphingorhabdus arenilitoris]|uniref:Uncharacterized protein n=1 Tax=Sphingorhabdus arenilitoris TaxID=1490041 RepID=A0ABV8RED8_9SPHN